MTISFRDFPVLLLTVLLLSAGFGLKAQVDPATFRPDYEDAGFYWADSVLKTMSLEQKIGQLIWPVYEVKDGPHSASDMVSAVSNHGLGGMIVKASSSLKLNQTIGQFQKIAPIPLFIGTGQGDWGIKEITLSAEALGALSDPGQIGEWGKIVGSRLNQAGINLFISPYTNPGTYAFQTAFRNENDRKQAFILSLQEAGIMPVISGLEGNAVQPDYLTLTKQGAPALFSVAGELTSDQVRENHRFRGIWMEDMRNADKSASDLLIQGRDVLLYAGDLPGLFSQLMNAVNAGDISSASINEKCRKVLTAKYWAGLTQKEPQRLPRNFSVKSVKETELLSRTITVVSNKNKTIPFGNLGEMNFASVVIGNGELTPFQQTLDLYTQFSHFHLEANATPTEVENLTNSLGEYSHLVVGIYPAEAYSKPVLSLMEWLATARGATVVSFTSLEANENLTAMHQAPSLVFAWQEDRYTQNQTAQILFGAVSASGRLPQAIGNSFVKGEGVSTPGGLRMAYTSPEAVGWNGRKLRRELEAIIKEGLDSLAFPGCQILVAKDNQVIFHEAYGYQTYDREKPVDLNDLYDLASVTKISGPLPALMRLVDDGKFNVDEPLKTYWPSYSRSNKGDLMIREILAHQARLMPYITYWTSTVRKNGKFRCRTFDTDSSAKYPVRATEHYYLHKNYRNKIYKAIRKSELNEEPGYVYSGLSFLLYPEIIENLSGKEMSDYLYSEIYHPLGAYRLTYNPWKDFPLDDIIPTEWDSLFRHQQVHGFVHDEAAAMLGGVSGNAGLFANVNDLAKLMQMYLQMGAYGGHQYISETTMKEFSSYQFPEEGNRRGLGFDKPLLDRRDRGFHAEEASESSFGHSGFTGTFTWVDPEEKLLLVFFSNRVYPTRANRNTYRLRIYHRLHSVLYNQ